MSHRTREAMRSDGTAQLGAGVLWRGGKSKNLLANALGPNVATIFGGDEGAIHGGFAVAGIVDWMARCWAF